VACCLIEEFGEDPRHYPEMLRETQNKMVSYYVCKTLLPSSHPDHKDLTQLFDLFEDCPSLQILLINQLIANNKRNEALATCLQFNLFDKLSARTKDLLQKAKHIQTNQFFELFGPVDEQAFQMPCKFNQLSFVKDLNTLRDAHVLLQPQVVSFYRELF
jgi:hypothetical protein